MGDWQALLLTFRRWLTYRVRLSQRSKFRPTDLHMHVIMSARVTEAFSHLQLLLNVPIGHFLGSQRPCSTPAFGA